MTKPLEEEFEALVDRLDDALRKAPNGVVALAVVVNSDGYYETVANEFKATAPQVYQAIGLLEQMKLDLLASVPRNRPLREPEAVEEGEADEPIEPIGQA
jgi:hypothetical protein